MFSSLTMHRFITTFACTLTFALLAVAHTPPADAGERCSKISGRCFEWPLLPDGSKLPETKSNGVWTKPDGDGPFPAIIIAESCGGSKPAVDKMWPEYFNELGYATYTPRVLERFGEKYCPSLSFVANNKNRIKMLSIIYTALDEILEKPYIKKDNVGVIGFSLGGISIRDFGEIKNLTSPAGNKFGYAIPVYPNCSLWDWAGDQIPTLLLTAEKDTARGKHKACLKIKSQNFPNLTYHEIKGAYHAFDDESAKGSKDVGDNVIKYDEAALKEAKEVIAKFLKTVN